MLEPQIRWRWFQWLVAAGIILTLLVVGRTLLVPLAIAVLFANLLNAMVDRVQHIHVLKRSLPKWCAAWIVIILVVGAVAMLVAVIAGQLSQIAAGAPKLMARAEALLTELSTHFGTRLANALRDAIAGIDMANGFSAFAGSAGSLLLGLGLVVVYVGFLMASQDRFSRKIDLIFTNPARATEIHQLMTVISARVRHYLWIKTLTSAMTGAASYIVLRSVGLDFAETWAFLIFLLNFIPNIGSPIAVIFPALLALLQFDGFGPFLTVLLILGAIQLIIDNLVEPIFIGRSLNLSSFVIILALVFWGEIWGVVGMFLSVPIMVVVAIVCAHVPGWRWIAVLLSDDGDVIDEIARVGAIKGVNALPGAAHPD